MGPIKFILNNKYYLVISLIFSGLIIANSHWWQKGYLGLPFALLYLFSTTALLGNFWTNKDKVTNLVLGICFWLATIIAASGILVNFIKYTPAMFFIIISVLPVIFYLINRDAQTGIGINLAKPTPKQLLFFIFQLFLIGASFYILFRLRTEGYIFNFVSLIPAYYWVLFFILLLSVFYVAIFDNENRYSNHTLRIIMLCLTNLLIYSTIIIIFKYMYGTDSWRHLMEEKYIAGGYDQHWSLSNFLKFSAALNTTGGFWSLIPSLSWMTKIDLVAIWKFINPLAASFLLPLLLFVLGKAFFDDQRKALIFATISIIPSEIMRGMIATPHTFGLITFFFSLTSWMFFLKNPNKKYLLLALISNIGALFSYATTGFFALIVGLFAIFIYLISRLLLSKLWKYILYIIFGILCIMLLLKIENKISGFDIKNFILAPVENLRYNLMILPTKETLTHNLDFIIYFQLILVLLGIYYLLDIKNQLNRRLIYLVIFIFLLLFITAAFDSIIDKTLFFRRSKYILMALSSLLMASGTIYLINLKSIKNSLLTKVGLAAILALVGLNFYWQPAEVWSISDNEVNAIKYLDKTYSNQNYIVLTDELTSAAGSVLADNNARLDKHYALYPGSEIFQRFRQFLSDPRPQFLSNIREIHSNQKIFFIFCPDLAPYNEIMYYHKVSFALNQWAIPEEDVGECQIYRLNQ